ncbi:MAG TPA: hypothetical protein VK703_16615 [Candidatus Acidoferrales bacterium]|jgi:hypothetical protein|nr:hypothetical protein [Candidatus Acidoferrales bacterium]
MPRQRLWKVGGTGKALLFLALVELSNPGAGIAWGTNAQRLIVNHAVDTLPYDLRSFFEANRNFLIQHVNDPLNVLDKHPNERQNHFIELDKYGKFPFEALPRSYKAALAKYSKSKIDSTGTLPWQIGVYSAKLTEDMKTGHWDEAKVDAAFLANYVAEAHDPFNTTENYDGRLTGQTGVNERFNTMLMDRYGSFFPLNSHDAVFITDPTDYAFDMCLNAHSVLEAVLLADRNAKRGQSSYTDEYYDHFYNLAAAPLIKQLSDASTDVGSYWLTAWTNAGKPPLPH